MVYVDRIEQKYVFVLAASMRARQLQGGAAPLLQVAGGMKATRVAMEEVMAGLVPIELPPAPGQEVGSAGKSKKKK